MNARQRPAYKAELLDRAKDAKEPVTETDVNESGSTLRVHAIQESDGVAYRAQITHHVGSESPPSVQFGKSHWNSDAGVLRDWTSLATGRLSGPQSLPEWESLFTVFDAALEVYNREVEIAGGDLDVE